MAKVLGIILVLLPIMGNAQSVFQKFENSEDIGYVSVNKAILSLATHMKADENDTETQEFIELAKSIDQIKVFVTENSRASAELASTAKKYIKKSNLDELMRVREDGSQVDFYVKDGKDDDHVSEMLMLVSGMGKSDKETHFETVVVSMTGDIDLTKIGALVNKLNLPKDLKKAEKKE